MKFHARLSGCILFLFMVIAPVSAQKKVYGLELCNSVYSFLRKSGFSPETDSLVVSGENAFPYNIRVKINSADSANSTGERKENLVLIIPQDDVIENQDALKETLTELSENEYSFNITVLFAYGEKQKLEKQDMIYGTQVFLESINSNLDYTAIIYDFDSQRNTIESISSGRASPPWLIKNSFNLYKELAIDSELPRFYLSQISTYKFIHNRQLSTFFDNDIPAILLKVNRNAIEKSEENFIKQIILASVEKYQNQADKNWERHFFIVKLFGRYRLLSEGSMLRIILPTVLFWIVFVFMIFFVNTRLKKRAWSTIKKVWYSVPVIYLLLALCFYMSRFIFTSMFPTVPDEVRIYGILGLQIIGSLFLSLCFIVLILSLNYGFDENAVDYLLIICCFINQTIFILIDISLSPIFIAICILSVIALFVKNNALHVFIFFLMIVPLVPYGNSVISIADTKQLGSFIKTNNQMLFSIPLALYPNFIIIFRTLTSMRSKKNKISRFATGALLYFVIVSASLITLGIVRSNQLSKKQSQSPSITISTEGSEFINISYSDRKIFDDLIRTLNVELKEDCILCDVQVVSRAQNPVLYTDNDYRTISSNSVRFSIPDYPPRNMTFSYGASTQPCRITVSAVIEDEENGTYKFISRYLSIGDN